MAEGYPGLTRRRFLEMVGLAGGSTALYETMTALGMINIPAAWAGPPSLRDGQGQEVVVLGSGIGGLTAAFMLHNARYKVRILEAQDRAGGRSLTARRGTVIDEQSQNGATRQICQFDEGLYLNMGPGRIPYHHRRVLHYCRLLGVPLEVYVMETTANLFQTDRAWKGERQINRRIANDTRGYIAEMLAKAIRQDALDEPLDIRDRERLLSLLKKFGDLGVTDCEENPCDPYEYCGSTRSGCGLGPTIDQPCCPEPKLSLAELLRSEFWNSRFYQPVEFLWQPTLFQPVGGMDQIVEGFVRRIGNLISFHSEVREIRTTQDGVVVSYRDRALGEEHRIEADFCVTNIPLPVLQKIAARPGTNFPYDFRRAIDQGRFAPTCKVGWQAEERFWETHDEIYGGISWIDNIIAQMWYPSNDYFSAKGTLTGAYNFDSDAVRLGDMGLEERLRVARQGAVKLHPQFAERKIVPERLGLSIAWQNVPFQRGGWADWKDTQEDREAYERLLLPDSLENPRVWIVGDQVSTLPGWQEGAMMSAEHVVPQITGDAAVARRTIRRAPVTRTLVDSAP